jgi:hypothetical protein
MATMEIEMVDCGQRGVAEELKALMSKRNRNGRLWTKRSG